MNARAFIRVIAMLGAIALGADTVRMRAREAPPPSERYIAVISDLHFGLGKRNGAWHPMEDFRWAAEFQAFLM
jgi:hypothetical protein